MTENPVTQCSCSEERCQKPRSSDGPRVGAMMTEFGGRMTLEEIGEMTTEDPILCQMREEIRKGRSGEVERSLIRMKSPRIGMKQTELGSETMHVRNIKPIHLSIVQNAILVNNRAWIPEGLIFDTMRALHTKSHKCYSRMMR